MVDYWLSWLPQVTQTETTTRMDDMESPIAYYCLLRRYHGYSPRCAAASTFMRFGDCERLSAFYRKIFALDKKRERRALW